MVKLKDRYVKTLLVCFGYVFSGPLFAYIESPYAATFQTIRQPVFAPSDRSWQPGEIETVLALSWMNVWSIQDERFIIDGEEVQIIGKASWAVTDRWRISVKAPYKFQGGGTADSAIERAHAMTGVTQGQRDRFPRNKFNVSYEPLGSVYPYLLQLDRFIETVNRRRIYPRSPSDPPILNPLDPVSLAALGIRPDAFPEDIFISGRDRSGFGELNAGAEYMFRTSGLLRTIILGLQATGSGADRLYPGNAGQILTGSIMAETAEVFAPWRFSVSAGYSVFDRREFRLLSLPGHQWTLKFAVHRQSERWNYFFEYAFFSSPVQHMGRLSEDGHQFAVGAGYRVTDSGTVEFAFIENFLTYATTPDAGLYAAYRMIMN